MNKYVITRTKQDKYTWTLFAYNGEAIAYGHIYASLAGCKNAIESVKKYADSKIEEKYE